MVFTLLAAECQERPLRDINSAATQWQRIFDSRCAPWHTLSVTAYTALGYVGNTQKLKRACDLLCSDRFDSRELVLNLLKLLSGCMDCVACIV